MSGVPLGVNGYVWYPKVSRGAIRDELYEVQYYVEELYSYNLLLHNWLVTLDQSADPMVIRMTFLTELLSKYTYSTRKDLLRQKYIAPKGCYHMRRMCAVAEIIVTEIIDWANSCEPNKNWVGTDLDPDWESSEYADVADIKSHQQASWHFSHMDTLAENLCTAARNYAKCFGTCKS